MRVRCRASSTAGARTVQGRRSVNVIRVGRRSLSFDLVELVLDAGKDVGQPFDFAAPATLAYLGSLFEQPGVGALQA